MTVLRCACDATVASADGHRARIVVKVVGPVATRNGVLTWAGLSGKEQPYECRRCGHHSHWTIDQLVLATLAGKRKLLVGTAHYGPGLPRWTVESSSSTKGWSRLVISTVAKTAS